MYLRRLASTCGPLKLDIPDDYVPLLITALEQYYAYTRAVKREETACSANIFGLLTGLVSSCYLSSHWFDQIS
jgi:hypothetical protein